LNGVLRADHEPALAISFQLSEEDV
jgi:hypothetical protein